VLESYKPFVTFRDRFIATGVSATAAQQTKAALNLAPSRDEIKETLIDLGTYSQAFSSIGGGRYQIDPSPMGNRLQELLVACVDTAAAEQRIREQLGPHACAVVSYDEVITPLADALVRARNGDPRGAVLTAGNAVESYLVALAGRVHVALAGAGINAKLDELRRGNQMPQKLLNMGKYLGHVRNAADHGIDAEVNAAWDIRPATGIEFVFVACSFIAARTARERNESPQV
jgi:hypothetical protein